MQNLISTVYSQYANSPRIMALLEIFNNSIDPSANFDEFYNKIWNVDTAEGYGLDVWGRIVGISRTLSVSVPALYFGFSEDQANDYTPFDEEPFFNGILDVTSNLSLNDDAYRRLILIKAAANISFTTVATLNSIITALFQGRGRAYTNDYGHMLMRYNFEFVLLPYEVSIITNSGVLPAPSGVTVFYTQDIPGTTFGFNEAVNDLGEYDYLPFDDGPMDGIGAVDASATTIHSYFS